jgi:polyphosphate kinase
MSKKTRNELADPALYINRELSWLAFNRRVLREGQNPDVPLMERLKFLAIVSSNLDEFYMIRVAGLKQARAAGVRKRDVAGLTPAQQLAQIAQATRTLVGDQDQAINDVLARLEDHQVHLLNSDQWSEEQRHFLAEYFRRDVLPTLTPIAMGELNPPPLLPGLRLHLAVLLKRQTPEDEHDRLAVVPIPQILPRFITIPAEEGLHLARLEDVVAQNVHTLFSGIDIVAKVVFRITRDNDVEVDEDETGDLLANIERAIRQRTRRRVIRLELSAHPDRRLRRRLMDLFGLTKADVFEIDSLLDAKALLDVAGRAVSDELTYDDWPAQPVRDLLDSDDLYASLRDHDVLLFHPYESFQPVIDLVSQAADDPNVLAIKQTLYRTTGDSPIVQSLMRAARNGKQVTVLVELKARFDEARNVGWARALEDAGADVIYGVAGLKTHAKMLLIIRREQYGIRRYLHLSTGNYNDKTVKLYSDIGLMTTDRELAGDAAAFFNLLTGYSQQVGWSKMAIAPTGLRARLLELIDREIQSSTKAQPGLIMAKMNSLQCPDMCRALYRASQAGVRVRLNVRGICCLRPGVKGISENIEVISILDRFLEHARIYYFRNTGHEEVYLSSADWMVRNLDKRLETLFPVNGAAQKRRVIQILQTFFDDTVKATRLREDGQWVPRTSDGEPLRAQEAFYRQVCEDGNAARQRQLQFQPLRKSRSKSPVGRG